MASQAISYREYYTNKRALVIGINEYQNCGQLSFAANDAAGVKEALIKQLSFPEDKVTILLDGEATREGIRKAFYNLRTDDVDYDDGIIVYFAGHGRTFRGNHGEIGYLVPVDGKPDKVETLISWDELTKGSDLIRAKHLLFIFDACFGGLAITRGGISGSSRFLGSMLIRPSCQVLTAGKADETVSDAGGPLPGHSVFTGHLINGLNGGAADQSGCITANGLMAYVCQRVASDIDSLQTPHYGYIRGDGDFIFAPEVSRETVDTEGNPIVIEVPYFEPPVNLLTPENKIAKLRAMLYDQSKTIDMHDFMMDELKRFFENVEAGEFNNNQQPTNETISARVAFYDAAVSDLIDLLGYASYWSNKDSLVVVQKVITKLCEYGLTYPQGQETWRNLAFYPLIVAVYGAGIAAVANKRLENLPVILNTVMQQRDSFVPLKALVVVLGEALLSLVSPQHLFKQVTGYEKRKLPLNDHLLSILQPKLDGMLSLGSQYEQFFDEFEMLLAMVVGKIELYGSTADRFWAPVGLFCLKGRYGNSMFRDYMDIAITQNEDWPPFKAGVFGKDLDSLLALIAQAKDFFTGIEQQLRFRQ